MTLSKKEKGKRMEMASAKPVLVKYDSEEYFDLDPVLKQLKKAMVKDTEANREFAFWNDSISVSYTEITSAVIIGDGIKVRSEKKPQLKIIEDFNKSINVNGNNIEDWMREVWYDEIMHGKSFWRILIDDKYENKVDIQRVDPKTLVEIRDPKEGWTAFIQQVPDYKTFRSKINFYRKVKTQKILDYKKIYYTISDRPIGYVHITIPDEPKVLLKTKFFLQPPISTALHFIIHKRWTVYFMRKFAQKHWSPFILAMVGDPKTNFYPDTIEEMENQVAEVAKILPRIANWGGVALPGNVTVKALEAGSSKSADIYKDAIDILDKQIMMSIFSSMALRNASGSEMATNRSLLESFYTFIEGMRRKYIDALNDFYIKCLLPSNGYNNEKLEDYEIEFGTLRKVGWLEIAQAIERLNVSGAFKDDNELRRASSLILPYLKPLSKDQNKKREYINPNEQQTPFGGGSTPPAGSVQKNPQKKRANVSK